MIRPTVVLAGIAALSLRASRMPAQPAAVQPPGSTGNGLVAALWFAHLYGEPQALLPDKDRQLKLTLIEALRSKNPGLAWSSVRGVFEQRVFNKLADGQTQISLQEIERMLVQQAPRSRGDLFPEVKRHADLLTTQFDLIEEPQRKAAESLVAWICEHYQAGKSLAVLVVCTGNSRRSFLGATMGNTAAAYYGLGDLRFYSGGTTPSAFNPRTAATLKEIGVAVESTGKEAPRGRGGEVNPIYRVRWGKELESLEYSKHYYDAPNPQDGFAALLVCSEADGACPTVKGASTRIAAPYLDPKLYDGTAFEAAKYAERRDDIGRFMLNVLMQSRRRLAMQQMLP